MAVVEGFLHLVAVVDTAALKAGGSTPILNAHLGLAVVAYPLIGLPFAALAWFGGTSRLLTAISVGVWRARRRGGIPQSLMGP